MTSQHNIHRILHDVFGYKAFRGNQEAIIHNVLAGQDVQVIMPTGGGKSLCYQIPAIALDGLSIVVSPLIALMEDQVAALQQAGIRAEYIHSGLTGDEKRRIDDELNSGSIRLLYIAPESLLSGHFIDYLRRLNIKLFAIDEAHCISVWGNDFRPEYTKLSLLKEKWPHVPLIALTATADSATQEDIRQQLNIPSAQQYISSFERKNITINARSGQKRIEQILNFLDSYKEEAGIIYCLSRNSTEKVAKKLNDNGLSAAYYHAGMAAQERRLIQTRFQDDEIKIVCATIAFGMGIDKSNVRFVIHYNLPKNIESYYQEIGRSGRDGLPAESLLFYSWADRMMYQDFIDKSAGDEAFKNVQTAKLDRIWEFANASTCRTNMILSYFGEYREEACGHCDMCLHPPKTFDGTIITQKALSAIARSHERININLLMDVLKGASKSEITELGLHQIKTYGAGRDIPYTHWRTYLSQMINQGLIGIDYTQKARLTLTPLSKAVLSNQQPVQLVEYKTPAQQKAAQKVKVKVREKDHLFEKLRQWRKEKATEMNAPAYVIFSDATLRAITEDKPLIEADLLMIEGIGETKLERYGSEIIQVINEHLSQSKSSKTARGDTYKETYQLLNEGLSVEQIAEYRKLNPTTIYSHIGALYERGESININQYITDEEIEKIGSTWEKLDRPDALKPTFEALNGEYDYYKIRLTLSHYKRHNL